MQTETHAPRLDGDPARRETREPDARDGIFGTWIALTTGMIESTVHTSARFSRGVLGESERAVSATLGWIEAVQQSLVRSVRHANEGVFSLANEAVNRSERAALVVLRHGQATTDRASELASAASHAVIGSRGTNGAATSGAH